MKADEDARAFGQVDVDARAEAYEAEAFARAQARPLVGEADVPLDGDVLKALIAIDKLAREKFRLE